jgi:predicted pyridoxine 5'-phosphate oxidase superfamily flavin-nucleotide-binding protein
LDANTLGFIDFTGNRQYISVGNVNTNANTCLFLMDYPNRTRLKIFARTEVVELADRPDLQEKLLDDTYRSKPERMMLFHIEAYDWNCPQHITQRFSLPEIESLLAPEREYINQLEQELKQLKAKYAGK